jgi:hypothetical protein
LLDDQGRSEAAIESLREAVQVAPDYSDAMFNFALLLQRKNQCAEAADYWRRYLATNGQSEWASPALLNSTRIAHALSLAIGTR